jgi:hypothetical protein
MIIKLKIKKSQFVLFLSPLTKIEFFWSTIQAGRAIPKLVAEIQRIS